MSGVTIEVTLPPGRDLFDAESAQQLLPVSKGPGWCVTLRSGADWLRVEAESNGEKYSLLITGSVHGFAWLERDVCPSSIDGPRFCKNLVRWAEHAWWACIRDAHLEGVARRAEGLAKAARLAIGGHKQSHTDALVDPAGAVRVAVHRAQVAQDAREECWQGVHDAFRCDLRREVRAWGPA